MEPIYTFANCRFAYQLDWSVSVFWRETAEEDDWLEYLRAAAEADGVRILQHHFGGQGGRSTSQFLVSTRPDVSPQSMLRSVKGRLQHLLRDARPRAFRRHHGFRSIGSTRRDTAEGYVASQHDHHPMADPQTQELLARFRMADPSVDLARPRESSHGRYWYGLHVVLENEDGWCEVDPAVLKALWQMLLKAARGKSHLLSRASILANHVHLVLGCRPAEAPGEVALGYMNNLAYACAMQPIFRHSAYLGTLGEYDIGLPEMRGGS